MLSSSAELVTFFFIESPFLPHIPIVTYVGHKLTYGQDKTAKADKKKPNKKKPEEKKKKKADEEKENDEPEEGTYKNGTTTNIKELVNIHIILITFYAINCIYVYKMGIRKYRHIFHAGCGSSLPLMPMPIDTPTAS